MRRGGGKEFLDRLWVESPTGPLEWVACSSTKD